MANKLMVFTYPKKYQPTNKDLNGISRKKIMENDFVAFTLHGKNIRVLKGINGNPLWLAKDVSAYFGISDLDRVLSRIDEYKKKLVSITDSMGKTHKDILVNESGVYILTAECKPTKRGRHWGKEGDMALTEHCKKMVEFQHWVRDTVFPAILTFPEKLRAYADQLEWRERFDKEQMVAEKQRAVAAPKQRSSVPCH